MTDTLPRDVRESFEFVRDRHLGQPAVNYETLLTAGWPDWCGIETIEINVANGVMRWIAQLDDPVRRALVADLFAARDSAPTWDTFKVALWQSMDAASWLRRWDCWTPASDLWQAALCRVYHTFALYFYPSEWS